MVIETEKTVIVKTKHNIVLDTEKVWFDLNRSQQDIVDSIQNIKIEPDEEREYSFFIDVEFFSGIEVSFYYYADEDILDIMDNTAHPAYLAVGQDSEKNDIYLKDVVPFIKKLSQKIEEM